MKYLIMGQFYNVFKKIISSEKNNNKEHTHFFNSIFLLQKSFIGHILLKRCDLEKTYILPQVDFLSLHLCKGKSRDEIFNFP